MNLCVNGSTYYPARFLGMKGSGSGILPYFFGVNARIVTYIDCVEFQFQFFDGF